MALPGFPDGVHPPVDRLLLQRRGRLVARVSGPGGPAGFHPYGAGRHERFVRAFHLADLGPAGLPPGFPGRHRGHRRPRREVGHREVQQDLPAGPVCAGGAHCGLFPHPPGRAERPRLSVQARFLESDHPHLPGRAGAVVLFPVAGDGHHHHLFLLCEQEGEPDGFRRGNGRFRHAVSCRPCSPPASSRAAAPA